MLMISDVTVLLPEENMYGQNGPKKVTINDFKTLDVASSLMVA